MLSPCATNSPDLPLPASGSRLFSSVSRRFQIWRAASRQSNTNTDRTTSSVCGVIAKDVWCSESRADRQDGHRASATGPAHRAHTRSSQHMPSTSLRPFGESSFSWADPHNVWRFGKVPSPFGWLSAYPLVSPLPGCVGPDRQPFAGVGGWRQGRGRRRGVSNPTVRCRARHRTRHASGVLAKDGTSIHY